MQKVRTNALQMLCMVVCVARETTPYRAEYLHSIVTAGTIETVYKEWAAKQEHRYLCRHCCSRQSWWSPGTLVSQALTEVTH